MSSLRRIAIINCLALGGLLTACHAPTPRAQATSRPAVPTDSSAALTAYIANQPYVTAEPAYRAMYTLWTGEMSAGDYPALRDALREARIVKPGWNHEPHDLVDRGAVGVMFCRAADIRTGLNWRLTGLGRYAWRELHYRGIVASASEYGYVSGGQFVGMLTQIEDTLESEVLEEPVAEDALAQP